MKSYFVLLVVCFYASEVFANIDLEYSNLREHEDLIFEISDVQIRPCPECHVQLDHYSYKVEIKDAYLGLSVFTKSARGPIYTPILNSHFIEEKGVVLWSKQVNIPMEGVYVGTVWKACAPWGMAADGSCRSWLLKYTLKGKFVNFSSN